MSFSDLVRELRESDFKSDFREIIKECLITNLQNEIQDETTDSSGKRNFDAEADDLLCSLLGSDTEVPSTIAQLMGYLECLDDTPARCAVIERNYIDSDFLDDYVSYYSRCYASHLRKCCRIHFFSENIKDKIDDLILNPKGETTSSGKTISDIYLGFVVLRPLRRTIVGRTCLKTYKKNASTVTDEQGRYYLSLRKTNVSFFGVDLTVECMPFQEQDHMTAACASCALWSAFSVSSQLFKNRVPSPSAITAIAVKDSFSSNRMFPNQGLSLEQMCYAVRKMELDPVVIQLDQYVKPEDRDYVFRGAVSAYLNLGVPVIAILDAKGKYGYGKTEGTHAIAINGYHLSTEDTTGGDENAKTWLNAMWIDKFYANDDQCCPGAIFKPVRRGKEHLKIAAYHGHKTPSGDSESELYRTYIPTFLIIPLYHKIRVTFEQVAKDVDTCFGALSFAEGRIDGEDIRLDIALRESNTVKAEIANDTGLKKEQKLKLVNADLPRFVWCVRISYAGRKEAVLLIDTTDCEQGLKVVAVWFYSHKIYRLANNALVNCRSRDFPQKLRKDILENNIIRALSQRTMTSEDDFKTRYEIAQTGDPCDQFSLAWMYEHGEGTKIDLSKAVEWYTKAANQDYRFAMYNLAGVYEDLAQDPSLGEKLKKGYENSAITWYMRLTDYPSLDFYYLAWFRLGEIHKRRNALREAYKCYYNASNMDCLKDGNQLAQYEIAGMYEDGFKDSDGTVIVKQDIPEALKWYKHICTMSEESRIVNETYVAAMFKCGVLSSGAAARDWYLKAARAGHVQAQHNLGHLYEYGEHYKKKERDWSMKKNKDKARQWYELAAAQGHDEATQALAKLNDEW